MDIEYYLKENIDNHVTIKPWIKENILPVFLRDIYKFYQMSILNNSCILLEILNEFPNIDVIKKHIKRIKGLTNHEIVLYYKEVTRYRRKSLIENRIPFIIADGQIFLPFLGMDLKNIPEDIADKKTTFSTSTQVVYLYFLYNKNIVINTTNLAEKLGFTVMTASRALNDLYNEKLIKYKIGGKTGRSKEYQRIEDPEYFEKGINFIKSPIKKVVYVKNMPKRAPIAGLEALAHLSMLNPPNYPVRAIDNQQLKEYNLEIIKNKDMINDENLVELQIWDYSPNRYIYKNYVDLLSLYASLIKENDERIEQALQEALRGETWYMD